LGTRGFIGFIIDGTEKIAYNHWDSYPSGAGADVLWWLSTTDLTEARELAGALRVVDSNSTPTAEDVERLRQFANLNVGRQSVDDWYVLLRETQGNPAAMLQAGVIEDGSLFPSDSLMAEWGYIVDFDAGVFEVYRGFQKAPHDKGRFAAREPYKPKHRPVVEYWPCALVVSWPLDGLPSEKDFIDAVDPSEEEA